MKTPSFGGEKSMLDRIWGTFYTEFFKAHWKQNIILSWRFK